MTGAYDGKIRLWDAAQGRLLATSAADSAPVATVAVSTDNSPFVYGGAHGCHLVDATSLKLISRLSSTAVNSLSWAGGDLGPNVLVAGCKNGSILLLDARSGESVGEMNGHSGGVYSVSVAASGNLFVSGGAEKVVNVWDARSKRR